MWRNEGDTVQKERIKVEAGIGKQKAKEIHKYAHMIIRVYALFPPLQSDNTAVISDNKMLLDY